MTSTTTSREGHTHLVRSVCSTPDGTKVITGSWDKTIIISDLESGKQLQKLEGHTGGIYKVCVTPDGSKVLSSSEDHTVRVWSLISGSILHILKGHTGLVRALVVARNSALA